MEKIYDNISIMDIIRKEYENEFFDCSSLIAKNNENTNQFILYGEINLDNIGDLKQINDLKNIKQIESNLDTFVICTITDNYSLIIDNVSDIFIYKSLFPDRIDIDFDKKEWSLYIEKIKIEG
jgi:hypothetical protein|nr:MAG TPA: hypothetical protein [Caudoviricetes sp.]